MIASGTRLGPYVISAPIGAGRDGPALGGNVITITSPAVAEVKGSGWGFNVGGDAGLFFSQHVGVGGTFIFNRGTVNLDDPLVGVDVDREAGLISFGGGLRFRF